MNYNRKIELYKSSVTPIRDFPKKGIVFWDISELVKNHLAEVSSDMKNLLENEKADRYAGIESRGFLFAGAMASLDRESGVIMIRKKGKLPPPIVSITYKSEYSTETLEVKVCNDPKHNRVCIVDDCAALGNTFIAAGELLEKAGYRVVGRVAAFKLSYLPGDKSQVKALWEYAALP
ncbi:MAG: adenine phosphoribosyltransferase [Rickettsiales bacterium]|jgi:adenine phosphoribosyltransferase|nr:adenine phosphoribosyltransferase [Rickettsiales bacterium]